MDDFDIVFAKTVKDQSGVCEVFYADGTSDIKTETIGSLKKYLDLLDDLKKIDIDIGNGHYSWLTRSEFVCDNNIVMIHPSQCKLVIAFDSLEKKHMELSFSDHILRRLRGELYNVN